MKRYIVAFCLLGLVAICGVTCSLEAAQVPGELPPPAHSQRTDADTTATLTLADKAVEHDLVTITSTERGRWVVLGPDVLVRRIGAAIDTDEVNSRKVIVCSDGVECVWTGPPGIYLVQQWPDVSVAIAQLVVYVAPSDGPPTPPRPPPPDPTPPTPPEPDDPPAPESSGCVSYILLRVAEDLTADQAATILDLRTWVDEQDEEKFGGYVFDPSQVTNYGRLVDGSYPFMLIVQEKDDESGAVLRWRGTLPDDANEVIQEMRRWRK